MRYFTRLDYSIINKYIDRKHSGMITFFYNTKIKKFIPIPKNLEHAQLVAKLLGVDMDSIAKRDVDASYFIPVVLVIVNNEYQSMIIGSSSLEMALNVRHKKEDLINTENATLVLLERSPLKIKEDFQKLIVMKYAA